MKYALFFLLLLAGCARRPATTPRRPKSEPIGVVLPRGDKEFVRVNSDNPAENGPSRRLDSVVVAPHRSVLDKLLGRTPASKAASSLPVKVGKKSTVSIYYGPATVSTTTVGKKATAATAEGAVAIATEKKAGPVVLADSGATVQVAASQKGPAAAAGRDATATTIKPPTPWLKYGLWLVGIGTGYWLLFGGGGAVLLALWRRNKPNTDNQA
jgi:hypothetical protein